MIPAVAATAAWDSSSGRKGVGHIGQTVDFGHGQIGTLRQIGDAVQIMIFSDLFGPCKPAVPWYH